MVILKCIFSLAVLTVVSAQSWDMAVTTESHVELYSNTTKVHNETLQVRDLTALAYDAAHNMLLFADGQQENASIFSFYITNKKHQALVRRRSNVNIHGLAFDPVKGLLFWTDIVNRSIYWISMKQGFRNDLYGNLLFKMDDEIPRGIAVDSCRGYIYWTNTNIPKSTIERARFDGTDRQTLVDKDIYNPSAIAIDQQTKKIYWTDDKEGIPHSIESADLDGKNRRTLLLGTHHRPNALTISKDSIYWVDLSHSTIWKLPKEPKNNTEPVKYMEFVNETPFGIAANYPIEDQVRGQPECDVLKNLSPKDAAIDETLDVSVYEGNNCVHGTKQIVNGNPTCVCDARYTGERCDVSVCQSYCLNGDCSFTTAGQPTCRCKRGFTGDRCQVGVCQGYCLNKGDCSLNENYEPVCQCTEEYKGLKCEELKVVPVPKEEIPAASNETAVPVCNCTAQSNTESMPPAASSEPQQNTSSTTNQVVDEIIPTCVGGWDPVRDPVILALGILVGFLCLVCLVLITKIIQLRKRPRIKKRIIVNKNVTPMTARPDQCEITIENCCNMNICETPCFEPRSTIRPSLLDSKPGKEEKKNLIANMEYPDDY